MKVIVRIENMRIFYVLTYVALHLAWLKRHPVLNKAVMFKIIGFIFWEKLYVPEYIVYYRKFSVSLIMHMKVLQ